jgi:hypothetical protein
MKTTKRRSYAILIFLLLSIFSTYADNQLILTRPAGNMLEILLNNSDQVYGVQFSLRTSSDITLGKLERGARTVEEHWLVASYKPNDSVVNVIIISTQNRSFPNGQGALASISIASEQSYEMSYALLSNVMITNGNADSLGVVVHNLDWSNKSLIAKNDEPQSCTLGQNFPNPFNPSTKIVYRLQKASQVRLSIYDITGREVNRLVDRFQSSGEYTFVWNSNDSNGQKLASGMYFARLKVDNISVSRKMVMTK